MAWRHLRRARFASTLAVVALLCYGAAALPWFRIHVNTVLLHGGREPQQRCDMGDGDAR